MLLWQRPRAYGAAVSNVIEYRSPTDQRYVTRRTPRLVTHCLAQREVPCRTSGNIQSEF